MNGAVPAVFLLTAVGAWEAVQFLKNRLFAEKGAAFAVAAAFLATGLILVQASLTFRTYFHQWAYLPYLDGWFGTEWREVAKTLNTLPSNPDDLILIPSSYPQWRYSLQYLFQGPTPIRLIDPESTDLAGALGAVLKHNRNLSTAKIVEWNTDNFWIGDDIEPFMVPLRQIRTIRGY